MSYSFLPSKKKKKKSRQALHEIFCNTHYLYAVGASSLYFKITNPLFRCPLFFKEYLNLQVRIKKQQTQCQLRPKSFRIKISNTSSRISKTPLQVHLFYFSEILVSFSVKAVYCSMVGKNFHVYSIQITGKYALRQKN